MAYGSSILSGYLSQMGGGTRAWDMGRIFSWDWEFYLLVFWDSGKRQFLGLGFGHFDLLGLGFVHFSGF